ncbi:hypothetical protein BF36_5390 (plasmid) [Bacillus thuringiensis]|nr:hypothetical protein BF36_5390 [Bacillus thuringiensis]
MKLIMKEENIKIFTEKPPIMRLFYFLESFP